METGQVREIEALAADAWPAAELERLDGWRLRANGGVTGRANSVWPNEDEGRLPLEEKLGRVEAFYAARRLPALYQVCSAALPADLDRVLERRGYRIKSPTCVQTAPLERVRASTGPLAGARVTMSDCLEPEWWSVYREAEARSDRDAEARRGILGRIHAAAGYALLELEGRPAAIGVGVRDGRWLGIFCMATRPEFRRRGAATALLHALSGWGRERNADRIYLQVMEANSPARSVYARAGFTTLYGYHYREQPNAGGEIEAGQRGLAP